MKSLLTLSLVLLCLVAKSQNNDCKNIEKETNDLKVYTKYHSTGAISFYKNFRNDTCYNTLVAEYGFPVRVDNPHGIFVKLDDGAILKNENSEVICNYISGTFWYYSEINLTKEYLELLTKHKIVKYGIHNFQQDVKDKNAVHYLNYINCLNSIIKP